jgi:hypothetical protein
MFVRVMVQKVRVPALYRGVDEEDVRVVVDRDEGHAL